MSGGAVRGGASGVGRGSWRMTLRLRTTATRTITPAIDQATMKSAGDVRVLMQHGDDGARDRQRHHRERHEQSDEPGGPGRAGVRLGPLDFRIRGRMAQFEGLHPLLVRGVALVFLLAVVEPDGKGEEGEECHRADREAQSHHRMVHRRPLPIPSLFHPGFPGRRVASQRGPLHGPAGARQSYPSTAYSRATIRNFLYALLLSNLRRGEPPLRKGAAGEARADCQQ